MSVMPLPTVLTVENDPIKRADLRLVLEDGGFAVCPDARDGVEAVELVREHRPDVILLNLDVPRLDGAEAVRRIRREHDVPIVALTGHRRGNLIERPVDVDSVSCVLKPSAEREVVDALREALLAHAEEPLLVAPNEPGQTLADVLRVLGYPEDYAPQLERLSRCRGKVWQWSSR